MSGSANYTGDYVGLVSRNTNANGQRVSLIIDGDAALSANFSSGQIDGVITNRRISNSAGTALNAYNSNDVRFNAGNINDNGTFNLSTTGGNINTQYGGGTVSNGSVAGILGGNDASSVAGHIQIDHRPASVSSTYQENGSFVAN
jgi:hypothetical protein